MPHCFIDTMLLDWPMHSVEIVPMKLIYLRKLWGGLLYFCTFTSEHWQYAIRITRYALCTTRYVHMETGNEPLDDLRIKFTEKLGSHGCQLQIKFDWEK